MSLFFGAHRSHRNVRSVSIQLRPPRPPQPFGKHRQIVNTHHRKCASAPHSVSLQSSSTVKMQMSEFRSTFIGEEHSERRKQVTRAPLWSWKPSLRCGGGRRSYAHVVAAFFWWNSFIRLSSSGRKWRMRPCNKHTMMHRVSAVSSLESGNRKAAIYELLCTTSIATDNNDDDNDDDLWW